MNKKQKRIKRCRSSLQTQQINILWWKSNRDVLGILQQSLPMEEHMGNVVGGVNYRKPFKENMYLHALCVLVLMTVAKRNLNVFYIF